MLGFATVDHVPGRTVTVWLTGRDEVQRAGHTNAVTFDLDDARALNLAEQMIADRVVLVTDTSAAEILPISNPLTREDLRLLTAPTERLQADLLAAWEDWRSKPGKQNLADITLPAVPGLADRDFAGQDVDPATKRTLYLADLFARCWTAWLTTEGERQKRAKSMPKPLSSQDFSEFPEEFAARLTPVPLRAYR